MDRKVTVTGANILFFVFTVLYVFFQFILAAVVAIFGENFLNDRLYTVLLINQYVLILAPVVVYTLFKKPDIKEVFRLKPLQLPAVLIIFLMAFPAQLVGIMLNTLVVYGLQFIGNIPSNSLPVPRNFAELAAGIAVVAVSPAICEELLHRGIMLKAYERRGSLKAVAITSVFFGIFHFDITNFLGVIFLGFIIGYYVIRTDSIFAGMLAHFLNNLIYELVAFFNADRYTAEKYVRISVDELFSSLLYGLIGLIAVAALLVAFKVVTEGRCVMKPPISSVKNDIISIVTHWPVIIVLILYLLMAGLFILSLFIA